MKRTADYQIMVLAVVALGGMLLLGGCGTGGTSHPSSPPLRTVATFQGTGSGQTMHFRTSGSWVLAWTCNPYVDGVPAPYGLTIAIDTPDNYIVGDIVLDTQCEDGTTHGTIGIRQSGEQWISVGVGGSEGPWTLTVQVAASEQGVLLPTPTPTPTPSPTPTPVPTPLPITFTGSGINSTATFTTNVTWNLISTCTTSTEGAPYTITMHVMQPRQVAAQQVGQDINFVCNGQTDTDQSNPAGFPPGTYYLVVATGGDWKITVEKKQ